MKNLKMYFITILASILLLVPSLYCECSYSNLQPLYDILSGIGCSGIAAAIIAIFLEYANNRREQEKLKKAKSLYFKQLYDQLIMLIERFLWFNDRLKDADFNWNLRDYVYSTLNYMVAMGTCYSETTQTYDDAINKLKKIGEKYNLENIKTIAESERHKVTRLFQIVAASSSYLLNEANAIKDNKLTLDIMDYMSMDENKDIMIDISFFIAIMSKTDKNYQVAVDSLINVTERVREIGQYPKGDIRIGLHGSFPMSEL